MTRICEELPEELIIESILTRLPAQTLAVCCCVSKLWLNTILNDSRFSLMHYKQNKNKIFLVFHLRNVSRNGQEKMLWFSLLRRETNDIRMFSGQYINGISEQVGFCNGLACVKQVSNANDTHGSIGILNPNRSDSLVIPYTRPAGEYLYLCHGFGFDTLSQVYKTVIVFCSDANSEFLCMVNTLGTTSWRTIVTSTSDISPPLGSSPFPSRIVMTRVSSTLCRQATFCGGYLFWRTKNYVGYDYDMIEMLLSFDLHHEKIQFIQLPTQCTPYERQDLVVHHLMELKGYPCILQLERKTVSSNDHCSHRCNYQTGACCCCYKVHMYMLKDKEKQVWTREETYDVQIKDQKDSPQPPLCWHFDTSAPTPPTRILNFCDQVLLYWFNGERLISYNLQEKHLKVVECSRTYPGVFQSKMNENLKRYIGDDDNIYCPSMDYQLHAQVENMISLKTFIPEGLKRTEADSHDELMHLVDKNLVAAWLTTGRRKQTFSAFF